MQAKKSKIVRQKPTSIAKNKLLFKKSKTAITSKTKILKRKHQKKDNFFNKFKSSKKKDKKFVRKNVNTIKSLGIKEKILKFFRRDENEKPDKILLILFFFLAFVGIITVFDTSQIFAQREFHNQYHFLLLQLLWISLGLVGFCFVYFIDYRIIRKFILILYLATIFLLFLTLFASKVNGASSWLSLGGLTIQPSELAKLTFVLYISGNLATKKKWNSTKEFIINDFIPFFLLLMLIVGFVVLGRDLGTSIIIVSVALFIYLFKSTTRIEYIAFFCLLVFFIVGGAGMIALENYRGDRVKIYSNLLLHDNFGTAQDEKDSGYQMKQVILALGSGGVFGVGLGESLEKYNFVETTPATDSVIAVLAEELGYVGIIVILCIFLLYIYRGFKISSFTKDRYGQIVAIGITSWFGMQVFLHIASNVVVTPLTGVPLPFLSYGGSSTISIMVATGILLNISKHKDKIS